MSFGAWRAGGSAGARRRPPAAVRLVRREPIQGIRACIHRVQVRHRGADRNADVPGVHESPLRRRSDEVKPEFGEYRLHSLRPGEAAAGCGEGSDEAGAAALDSTQITARCRARVGGLSLRYVSISLYAGELGANARRPRAATLSAEFG